jgi:S-adenosylmethionine:tRNA ribosyltransferase-isomerase
VVINFNLPHELIAQYPVHPRDSAKLLVYNRKTKIIKDAIFKDLNDYLPKKSVLVVNNSKVENCRWLFNDSKIEIFVLNKLDTHTITALVRPGKKFKLNSIINLEKKISAQVIAIDQDGIRTLKLNVPHDSKNLRKFEHVPLPPYIKQDDKLASEYQTVYAKPEGSKAAPTAGLHFTTGLLDITRSLHQIAELTLHVGLGTFSPLTESQLLEGKLHSEYYEVDSDNLEIISEASHITAVGTTSARTLESIFSNDLHNNSGWTDILIQPGHEFKRVDSLITNFHLPGTSLLLLVEAMVGSEEELQLIYNHAIKNDYRFYSFGDAMLVI